MISLMVLQLFGLMGFLDIGLSAIPATILTAYVGVSVDPLIHIAMAFTTSLGSRDERADAAVRHMFIPVMYGGVSTLVGLLGLALNPFQFIVKYVTFCLRVMYVSAYCTYSLSNSLGIF